MIDQAAINFLVKLSLACIFLSLAIFKTVDCAAIQNEQRQYPATDIQPAVGASAASNQIYQYQHNPQPQEYAQAQTQDQAQAAQQNFQQYYDHQQTQPQQQQPSLEHLQYQQSYETVSPEVRPRPSKNNKPHRRSILSSLMAPFTAMRDQGMNMLSASLQGCQPNNFSLWCRFWSMFIRR